MGARAVAGLAAVATARLEGRGGRSVAALVGPGNNGADALYAVAAMAREGWNAVAVHHDTVHEGARDAAQEAGVVLTTDPALLEEADVVLDGKKLKWTVAGTASDHAAVKVVAWTKALQHGSGTSRPLRIVP